MPKFKLLFCDACKNLISVKDINKKTFICPLCGCINNREVSKKVKGLFTITSPKYIGEVTSEDTNLNIKEFTEELNTAFEILLQNGYKIKFVEI